MTSPSFAPPPAEIPEAHLRESTQQCHFKADAGYVCPLMMHDEKYRLKIVPFFLCDELMQSVVLKRLQKVWSNVDASFVQGNFVATDSLFVMIENDQTFVGCVGVDRQNFYAFISHLYVVSEMRHHGYGRLLMMFAEKYVGRYGLTEARLWCDPGLENFYKKLGYHAERQMADGKIVMVKMIPPT